MTSTVPDLLAESPFLDYRSEAVRAFVARAVPDPEVSLREKAVALFYAVRDGVFYEVYGADLSVEGLRASTIATGKQGFCLHKSILYAAAVRSVGIPSRLVSGEVRNHLASERLQRLVGGDVFLHWLNRIELDGRWLYVTPVFNKMLCRLYGMAPLEFDGTADALYHPFDERGNKQMEFVGERTEYDDVDHSRILDAMTSRHPSMFADATHVHKGGSLAEEAPAAG